MENPWKTIKDITKKEYIADCDKEAIGKLPPNRVRNLQFNYLPQPYMGDPEQAEIFLLNGNPNAPDTNELGELSQKKFNEDYKEYILCSLENRVKDYPLYALNPIFKRYSIHKWWYGHLRLLIELRGVETVSKKLFAAEYFPYFSDNFNDIINIPTLESQKHTFSLIEKAMKAEKMVVIMRAKRRWYSSVHGLEKYKRLIVLNSPTNPCLTPKNMNMKPEDFDRIL